MSNVAQLYDVTKELLDHLNLPLPKDDREQYIERVDSLLAKRQQLIAACQSAEPASYETKQAQAIIEWNKVIAQKLQSYLNVIKVDMKKLKQQKQTGMKYENPYDAQPDGYFIDKKN